MNFVLSREDFLSFFFGSSLSIFHFSVWDLCLMLRGKAKKVSENDFQPFVIETFTPMYFSIFFFIINLSFSQTHGYIAPICSYSLISHYFAPTFQCTNRLKSTQALLIALTATFFKMFDVPVFWPILLLYFCMLFFLTMKRQIKHMLKHNYVPFSFGKQRYGDAKHGAKSSN
jgi:hypothetical protein